MAAPTFKQWLAAANGQRDLAAQLRGMSDSEQHVVYKAVIANDLSKDPNAHPGDPGLAGAVQGNASNNLLDYTQKAIQDYQKAKSNPNPATVPDAIAPTPEGKQNIADAEAAVKAAPAGAQKSAAQQKTDQLISTKGLGSYYPWMTASSKDGQNNPIDLNSGTASAPELSDDYQTKFRLAWNAQHPDNQFSDNASFMQSSDVVEGRATAQAAFEAALNVGSSSQTTYTYTHAALPGGHPGDYTYTPGSTGTAQVDTGAANAAKDGQNGGVPGLDKYMGKILSAASDSSVPWQVLWGVLRARLASSPSTTSGSGLFNLDATTAGAADTPESQIDYLARQLKAGYDQTNDWAFAALYTDNPASAMQLFQTGHSAPGRAQQDGIYVGAVFGGAPSAGGLSPGTVSLFKLGFGQQGQDAGHARLDLIQQQTGGSGSTQGGPGSGAGPTINLPDMDMLTQLAATTIQQYLFRAPRPGEAEAMAAGMRDASIAAQKVPPSNLALTPQQVLAGATGPAPGQQATAPVIDPQAAMTREVLGGSDAASLYAGAPGGGVGQDATAAHDYASKFQNVQTNMVGDTSDHAALREGMQQGNTDHFSGYLFGNSNDSTTFRQKLYQLASAIGGPS